LCGAGLLRERVGGSFVQEIALPLAGIHFIQFGVEHLGPPLLLAPSFGAWM
jgi:hypothetical protein